MSHEVKAESPRVMVSRENLEFVVRLLMSSLERRLHEKGSLSFAGKHEALGVITEEYHELVDAVHSKRHERMVAESIDTAVGCLWLVATLIEKDPQCRLAFLEVAGG